MQDKEYIEGLKRQDSRVLRAIYKDFAKPISQFIMKNGGSYDDAQDVFQDALLIILRKVQSPDFELTSRFSTYLFSINKYVWYDKARKKSRKNVTISEDEPLIDKSNIEENLLNLELEEVFEENFAKLGEFCQRILTMFFNKKSMTYIAEQLQLSNDKTAKVRKYRCSQKLKELVKADSRYTELKNR